MDLDTALNVSSAIIFMGVLGLMLSSLLAFANKKLWVFEDPRIDEIEEMLPATNCGACGNAGCRPFAEALIQGKVEAALYRLLGTPDSYLTAGHYFMSYALGSGDEVSTRHYTMEQAYAEGFDSIDGLSC